MRPRHGLVQGFMWALVIVMWRLCGTPARPSGVNGIFGPPASSLPRRPIPGDG
jgi:hypothetical protein